MAVAELEEETAGLRIVGGRTRPPEEDGIIWIPVRGNPFKRSRITGWMAVSKEPKTSLFESQMDPHGQLVELSAAKPKRDFTAFIEKSEPRGDGD